METILALECPVCRCPGEPGADNCVWCGRWLVVRDPNPPKLPALQVGTRIARLWDASCSAARGQSPAIGIEETWNDVYLGMQRSLGNKRLPPVLKAPIEACLAALLDLWSFVSTREVAVINDAWGRLLPAAHQVWELSRSTGLIDESSMAWFSADDRISAFDNPDD